MPFQQLQSYESQLQIHVSTLQAFHLIKNIAGIHNNSTHVTKNNKYTCYSTISECFSGVACVVKGLVFTCMTSTTTRTIYRTASSDVKTGLSRELSYTEVHTVTDESKGQHTGDKIEFDTIDFVESRQSRSRRFGPVHIGNKVETTFDNPATKLPTSDKVNQVEHQLWRSVNRDKTVTNRRQGRKSTLPIVSTLDFVACVDF